MKNTLAFILFVLFPVIPMHAQTLKGRITNQNGEAVPYATVYISELRQGTTTNAKGDYEIKLDEGSYKFSFQSLGYEPVEEQIALQKNQTVVKNISLPLQYYQIPEVRITASGEDPAYIIMRKVIGMAPYYLNNVKYYKAEVYLKGNLVINKIPKILAKQMTVQQGKDGKEVRLKPGDSFFMESYNEIEFTAPDKYFQKVISINSTFPSEGNEISPMEFIQASFYQPEIADMAISPLAPSAFSHYRFRYIGMSTQGRYTINKIQVIPKRKSQQLFEGTIFIIEDLWCLHSVDLTNENLAGKVRVRQLYVPVQDDIWMPVSHTFDINISIVGVKADASYGSSVKYLDVKPNLALKKPETITTNVSSITQNQQDTTKKTKTEEQISKILSKDEINNRDMAKLSKLMDKKSKESMKDSSRATLEVRENTRHEIAKDANKKDSAYWAGVRPIPLSDAELRAITTSDSVKSRNELRVRETRKDTSAVARAPEKKPHKFLNTLKYIGTGYTWHDSTGYRAGFGGLADLKNFTFNTVDGFVYGVDFNLGKTWKNRNISIIPQLKYAFGRDQLIWRVNSFYRFSDKRFNQIYARAGQASVDFNTGGGINLFLNSSFSLLLRRNNLKLYESGYFILGYMSDIKPGLRIDLSGTYEDRGMLGNSTNFSFFKSSRVYTENAPLNEFLSPGAYPLYAIRNMRHAAFMTVLTWTPFQRYRVAGERKIPMGSDWPTFTFTWRHGINEFSELPDPVKQYDMLRFEAARRTEIGAFSEFKWRVRTGGFLNKRYVTFYDFYHVNSQPLPVLLNSYEDAFMLPAFYSMATPEFFVQGHTKYTTPYLAVKYLPFISNTLMRENISLSYMGSAAHKHYTELGYSISEIFLLAEFGVYVGFENFSYKSAGVSLTLKLN
ncbi:MAG TPA: DUF5686 and carboxypeptidase regulatory-like domain-containing protein [Bacteroidales bacterium]|nr:DUF5686 and carboxypeptidase regulatory-like domain-containing protein [Bacteroidales bacterium]